MKSEAKEALNYIKPALLEGQPESSPIRHLQHNDTSGVSRKVRSESYESSCKHIESTWHTGCSELPAWLQQEAGILNEHTMSATFMFHTGTSLSL
jgi:hypothetical protein